jgi:pimeloyl-ACP methyl ester carboxylesterase
MASLPRACLYLVLGLAVAAPGETVAAQNDKKGDFKRVPFRSSDGVELQGTFYPGSGKRDAVVLLLHNIDMKKGGNSHQDGLVHLAERLQKDGYAVLTFDFRGFGDSKSVSKEFWDLRRNPYNAMIRVPRKADPPDSIDQKDFSVQYYPYLVNDIAAAKAYLDRKNDSRDVNSSNLIVIGCGEGATLGALWMASEWKKKKATAFGFAGQPMLEQDPEGKDEAAAVWLSISPTLAGRPMPVKAWLTEVAGLYKVPMAFLYGDGDTKSADAAQAYLRSIRNPPGARKAERLDLTNVQSIKGTSLAGSQLLQRSLRTEDWIVDKYLARVLEKRGSREWKKREVDKFVYFWAPPQRAPFMAKSVGEDVARPVPLPMMGIQGP